MIPTGMSPEETAALAELARNRLVLELGAQYGHSTIAMAATALQVVSVDWHEGDPQAGDTASLLPYLSNLTAAGAWGVVAPIIGRFENVLPLLRLAHFEMLFHDGYHEFTAMHDDLVRALPLLRWGAAIAVHDWTLFDVTPACEAVLGPPDRVVGRLAIWQARRGR